MSNTFFISDTHFGHYNIVHKFTWPDTDTPLRPFSSVEEMDETMVENWNSVVKPQDKVYHLGDAVIKKKDLSIFDRLNGRKTLVMGNHDIFYSKEYLKYFDNLRSYKIYPKHGIIFSHIPIYEKQLEGRFKYNVHGHLHGNLVGKTLYKGWFNKKIFIPDKRYLNICVEHINYTPISFDEILIKLGKKNEI